MRRRRSKAKGLQSLVIALALAAGSVVVLKPNERSLEGRAQVTDGDTIRIGEARIRLKGIDAPEMEQTCSRAGRSYRCGDMARRALIDMVSGENVQCRAAGRDRYQRILARCTVKGSDIGARMVEDGWAVSYGRDYDLQEMRAQSRSVGLWSGEFERPQDWRRSRG
ncbi:thermonuclease family protein [Microvirga guangxiensis]|uniref:Endonuclease YncB, thermonuclease family n=1 Tax=Microvirga guangxiensis TaxID=549386 RepID=A0A1G5BZI8_9HYPH|nr:thermonuclease family protein [Microvirga guangxiensis]SCX95533.1 Endonuclease YncB, thermonuclease family [Microvirga guangxiensis]